MIRLVEKLVFNKIKIRTKFLIWLLSLALIIIVAITGVLLYFIRDFSQRDSIVMIEDILGQVSQNISNRLDQVNNLTIRLYSHPDVLDVVGKDRDIRLSDHDRDSYLIMRLLQEMTRFTQNLVIHLFDNEKQIGTLPAGPYRYTSHNTGAPIKWEELQKDPLFLSLKNDQKNKYAIGHLTSKTWSINHMYIVMMRFVNRGTVNFHEKYFRQRITINENDPIGVMIFGINKDNFYNIFKYSELIKTGSLYLVNDRGEVLSSSDKKLETLARNTPLSIEKIKEFEKAKEHFSWIKVDNKKYLFSFTRIPGYNLYLYTLQPKKSILKNYYTLRGTALIMTLLLLILVILVALYISSSMSKPIEYLTSNIHYYSETIVNDFESGKFNIEEEIAQSLLNTIHTKDEIGSMARAFSRMIHKIKTMNLSLIEKERIKNELLMAKRIQLTVLPEIHNETGYDMSAKMIPAYEVGGDYYDYYAEASGRKLYLIGDVSGHGLDAGLIMFMVQAAVNILISSNPGMKIEDIVQELNAFLYRNLVEKMKMEEFMTFMVIEGYPSGRFACAGFHNFPIVYRAKTKVCEEVEAKGLYLGFLKDIHHTLSKFSFRLEKDDILVLYTDGIVEARNKEHLLYGMERLERIIKINSSLNVDEITANILDDVNEHMDVQSDDITLFVIKKK